MSRFRWVFGGLAVALVTLLSIPLQAITEMAFGMARIIPTSD